MKSPSTEDTISPQPAIDADEQQTKPQAVVSPQEARRILLSLMAPSVLMPLLGSMSRVALPIVRDDFQIPADMTAWVDTAFALPFMILMPLYGRLSDGVGKRRLILAGIAIYIVGVATTLFAPGLGWLMVGRAVQGIGAAGMMPLSMAFLTSIFPPRERGKALGTWSSVGPMVGFGAPLAAGFLVDGWGWRAAFVVPLIAGVLALFVVRKWVPAGLSAIRPNFWRQFDWPGVILLSSALIGLLFYLSSRPITGVPPLRDWRLLLLTLLLLGAFLWQERRRLDPYVALGIFRHKLFGLASICASMRMFTMSGLGFLVPLYLVDARGLSATYVGLMAMVAPGCMSLTVRYGGQLADKWGPRWPSVMGLTIQGSAMMMFSWLPGAASLWLIGLVLGWYGLGAGLVLAALHKAALSNLREDQAGSGAGLYSMVRFAGSAVGTALAGVVLQSFFEQQLSTLAAYQQTFLFFAGSAFIGAALSFWLKESTK